MTRSTSFDDQGGWPSVLSAVAAGGGLTVDQARATMDEVLAGRASDARLGGLLMALAVKGPSVDEIDGFVQSMLDAAEPLSVPPGAIDIVGTGGSVHGRRHALNVSTMASFVVAACGAVVCKHGNRRASSTSGAFDFLEALGLPIELDGPQLEACMETTGLGFAFARTFHPAMRFAGPVRSELGVPTVFNILGPLANPGRVNRQLIGTADEERAESVARVLHQRGTELSWVVTGLDGLDEITTSDSTVVFAVTGDGIERSVVNPNDVGIELVSADRCVGGDAGANAAIFERFLAGEASPQGDMILMNAGAALVVAGLASDMAAGVDQAAKAVADGAAATKLDELRVLTAQFSN